VPARSPKSGEGLHRSHGEDRIVGFTVDAEYAKAEVASTIFRWCRGKNLKTFSRRQQVKLLGRSATVA